MKVVAYNGYNKKDAIKRHSTNNDNLYDAS